MNREILDFLKKKRTGVIAVQMLDGSPHAATVHFSHIENPFTIIILTSPSYRKLEPLRVGATKASFVVGTEEEKNQKTFQLDGQALLADTAELRQAYFCKFPEKLGKHPEDVLFVFKPTWWRYTDWSKPEGKIIINSKD